MRTCWMGLESTSGPISCSTTSIRRGLVSMAKTAGPRWIGVSSVALLRGSEMSKAW